MQISGPTPNSFSFAVKRKGKNLVNGGNSIALGINGGLLSALCRNPLNNGTYRNTNVSYSIRLMRIYKFDTYCCLFDLMTVDGELDELEE